MGSCSDDTTVLTQPEPKISTNSGQTRSTVSEFESNWENLQHITTVNGEPLDLPWYAETSSNFSLSYRQDMKKEDGWILLSHSFNKVLTNTRKTEYIALYNQASGDLKVYIYPKTPLLVNNTAVWKVYFEKPQAWVNSLNEVSLPNSFQFTDSFIWNTYIKAVDDTNSLCDGWNVLTIPGMAYDPNAGSYNSVQILAYAENGSWGNLVGDIIGDINGKLITVGSKNSLDGVQSALSSLAGAAAEDWAKKTLKVDTEKQKGNILGSVASGIGALVKAGASKILNGLFGRFSKPTYSEQNLQLKLQASANFKSQYTSPSSVGMGSTGIIISGNNGIKLGSWNLSENPIIYIHPVGVMSSSVNGIQNDEAAYTFVASGASKANIVFNPDLTSHIIKYEVECVPVAYSPKRNSSDPSTIKLDDKLPQIPSGYNYSDFGSIGSKEPVSSYRAHYPNGSTIYTCDDYTIFDNKAQGNVTYMGIWNKYGKYSSSMPLYKYIYAPDNNDICRGGQIKVDCKYNFVKVIVTMITEFESKRDTIVSSRTYKPRFEWDPDKVSTYRGTSMVNLQGLAERDAVLQTIDNGYYDNLKRSASYNTVQNDSTLTKEDILLNEELEMDKLQKD